MAEKTKKDTNVNYYDEPVFVDEMQKAVSNELEHRSLRLWYALNSIAMWVTMVMIGSSENPPAAIPKELRVMLLIQYGIMYFCLTLYNLRAADKGVLDSFSPFQKGNNGLLQLVSCINIFAPTQPLITYFMGKGDNTEVIRSYLTFFIVWACMAWTYYFIATYCVYRNKKVRDGIAADEENEEE